MQLRSLTWLGLTLALAACTDDGIIGKEPIIAAGAGGVGIGGAAATGGTSVATTTGGTLATLGGSGGTATTTAGGTLATLGGSGGTATTTAGNGGMPAAGSGNAPAVALFSATASNCALVTTEPPQFGSWAIPAEPATAQPAAMWGNLLANCAAGGWDLAQCAGAEVTLVSASTNELSEGSPVVLRSIIHDERVCCAYRTYSATPGILPASCGPHALAARAAAACGTSPSGKFTTRQVDVPTDMTGPDWGLKSTICADGGWDLSRCAGSTATATVFETFRTSSLGLPMTTWVVTRGNDVCCIFDSDTSRPGLYAHQCAP